MEFVFWLCLSLILYVYLGYDGELFPEEVFFRRSALLSLLTMKSA